MERIASTRRGITAAVVLLVALLFLGLLQAPAYATPLERQMLRLTNASRETRGVHRLRFDAGRSTRAHKHSAAMARSGEIFHTNDPSGYYLRGVRWSRWGENVGRTTGELDGLQDDFMGSAVHRRNILDPRFRKVGVGVVKRGGTSWVTLFFYG